MKNLSTKDTLNFITNLIYDKLDNSEKVAITYLDLAKAFNTVNHKILLDKLYNYGVRGNAHKLMESYLHNRQQRVIINGKISNYCSVNTGVPQGTVLGPLLFLLYVNDLLTGLPDDIIVSFADDTAVISTGKNWLTVETNMNIYLNKIQQWLALNELSLNIDKTVFITFGIYCDSVPKEFNVQINGQSLKRVEDCKYLGIVFDYRMLWYKHIEYLISKTKFLICIFYKLSKFMLTETLRSLYYALFHSIISYGIVAWGGAYSNNLNLLQRLQNRILKIVNKNLFITSKNPLNLDQLFAFESLKFHYNDLRDKFLNSSSITRNKSILLPARRKTISRKNSYIRAISIFNNLPNELKCLSNIKTKKKRMKEWVAENLLSIPII